MTITWGNTKTGSSWLLPEGTNNYEVTSAGVSVNEYSGRRQIIFGLQAGNDTGSLALDLEADSERGKEAVAMILKGMMMTLGFEPSNPDGDMFSQVVPEFLQTITNHVGKVVELRVKHETYDKKTADGFPKIDEVTGEVEQGTRQKVYWNRLVSAGTATEAKPIDTSMFEPAGGGVPTDDIPF